MTIQEQYQLLRVSGNTVLLPDTNLPDYKTIRATMLANHGRYKKNKFEFSYDPTGMLESLCQGIPVNMKKDFSFFPTPTDGVTYLMQLAQPKPGERILEPSAGDGALAKGILQFCETVDCVEINPINRAVLTKNGFTLVGEDFLDFTPTDRYDKVIANPPFSDYISHFWHMLKCVKPRHEIWMYAPAGLKFRTDKKTKAMYDFVAEHGSFFDVPSGTFRASGTMVETVIIGIINHT